MPLESERRFLERATIQDRISPDLTPKRHAPQESLLRPGSRHDGHQVHVVKMAPDKPPIFVTRRGLHERFHDRGSYIAGVGVQCQHLSKWALENQQIGVGGRQNGLRTVLYREPVVGGHQGLEACLVSDQLRTLPSLLAADFLDLGVDAGLRAQRRSQVQPYLVPHSCLDEHKHRCRQQKHNCQHGDEKFRPQVFERLRQHTECKTK